jgi:UDP-N-acetylmuramoyl-tripeptide--D-alanyl-D-alanine ligase
MTFLSTTWVASALGAEPPENERHLTQITSDSRETKPGALFVALQGENTDGHAFVEKAHAAGATALVHHSSFSPPPDMVSFAVENPLEAWRLLAAAWRLEFHIPIAVVAGSSGKTTTKELLAALFRGKWGKVLHTLASQNGFQGVPNTLLRLSAEHEAAVIEVGIDDTGAMAQHLALVRPDCGLLTSIGPEHLERLIDLDTVESEEGILFKALEEKRALAAVNLDDPRIARQAAVLGKALTVTYSLQKDANIRGELSGNSMTVRGLGQEPVVFPLPLEGAHNAMNLLGAIALSHGLGLSAKEMLKGLTTFSPPPGRSETHSWNGCKVLVDTYNANPSSVEAALDTLFTDGGGESWACLADMLEMGTYEESFHRNLADPLLRLRVKHVLLYGPRMKHLESELRRRGFGGTLEHFDSHEMIAARLRASVKPGDRILLKGSRGMRMESVWKALLG